MAYAETTYLVPYKSKNYYMHEHADYTNRAFDGNAACEGNEYIDEFSAAGIDDEGNKAVVTWQFTRTRDEEIEDENLPWDHEENISSVFLV